MPGALYARQGERSAECSASRFAARHLLNDVEFCFGSFAVGELATASGYLEIEKTDPRVLRQVAVLASELILTLRCDLVDHACSPNNRKPTYKFLRAYRREP
jgi:hypothetical protein